MTFLLLVMVVVMVFVAMMVLVLVMMFMAVLAVFMLVAMMVLVIMLVLVLEFVLMIMFALELMFVMVLVLKLVDMFIIHNATTFVVAKVHTLCCNLVANRILVNYAGRQVSGSQYNTYNPRLHLRRGFSTNT